MLFNYSHVTSTGSSFTIDIVQANTNAAFNFFGVHKGQVNLYNAANCSAASVRTQITLGGGQVHIVVSGATFGQTFIIGVKYDPNSVVGQTVGNHPADGSLRLLDQGRQRLSRDRPRWSESQAEAVGRTLLAVSNRSAKS